MEFHCIISVNRFINKKFSLTFLLFHLHRKKRKDDDKKLIHINIYISITKITILIFQRDIRGKYLTLTNKANQQNYQDHHFYSVIESSRFWPANLHLSHVEWVRSTMVPQAEPSDTQVPTKLPLMLFTPRVGPVGAA